MLATGGTACWVDVFELPLFRGRRRRLFGPARFVAIRTAGTDWGIAISSVIVGPGAYLRFFRSADPRSAAFWMEPEHSFQDLHARGVGADVDSIAILEAPPAPGDPGYESFISMRAQEKTHG